MGVDWSAVEWGTVGEWVSGIGALGAVIAAVVISHRESRERRWRHARAVDVDTAKSTEWEGLRVRVHNGSEGNLTGLALLGPASEWGGAAPVVARKRRLSPGKTWEAVIPDEDRWTGIVFFADVNRENWAIDTQQGSLARTTRNRYRRIALGMDWRRRFEARFLPRRRRRRFDEAFDAVRKRKSASLDKRR